MIDKNGENIKAGTPVKVDMFNIHDHGLVVRFWHRVIFDKKEDVAEVRLKSGRFIMVTSKYLVKEFW